MTSATPFARVLVPYDGSDPARAALKLAIAFGKRGAAIVIGTVVDEAAVIAEASSAVAYDPSPEMEALDEEGDELIADAAAQCRAAGVEPVTETVHETPVAGILSIAKSQSCDLIVMGTHARTGVAHAFLGSTTEGVLRWGHLPVLTVRTVDHVADEPFSAVLVAIDDSEPSDAAAGVAAMLARTANANVIACGVVETLQIYENTTDYGFDPAEIVREVKTELDQHVHATLERAGLPAGTAVAIVEGDPAEMIVATAKERNATLIISGTHGRRGIRRFFLGSVAEDLVRTSETPVLVVPVVPKPKN
ncbi:MAG: universal stress protein [Candidatus Lustribacter sp.]|jgi:nucleotide-binding universal stress UspA family protein